MDTSHLYTLWLPMVTFSDLIKNIEQSINSNKPIVRCPNKFLPSRTKQFDIKCFIYKKKCSIYIDSLGFIYIDTSSNNIDYILEFIIENILNSRTKELIYKTFLNRKISSLDSKSDENLTMLNFLKNIYRDFKAKDIDDIILELIEYKLNIENKDKSIEKEIKLTLKDDYFIHPFYNIINRNFKKLLQKSLFFSHGLKYDRDEIYNLSIFNDEKIRSLTDKLNLTVNKNNEDSNDTREILENILKKAIQDTIEEETLLHFLKQSKRKYVTKIYKKISLINKSINKLNYDILAIEENRDPKPVNTEEDIEIFVQNMLQVIPKFKVIDSKIKNAYYIKVGNMTTSTNILEGEIIENTLFYQKWKSAIDYFENMAKEIKEVLIIYHQNKTIKELENITYYENFQADIDDIKSIRDNNYNLSEKAKSYFDRSTVIIGTIALSGEAPIFQKKYQICEEDLHLLNSMLYNFAEIFINGFIYFILITLLLKTKNLIPNSFKKNFNIFINDMKTLFKFCFLGKNEDRDIKFYKFDISDYNKHEHRSTKPIYTYSIENGKEDILTVYYRDVDSAYDLMRNLKRKRITKLVKNSLFTYEIFPSMLRKPYVKDGIEVKKNYRITRIDKVITKLSYRYKITDIYLESLINEIENNDKNFLNYFKEINANIEQNQNSLEDVIVLLKEMLNMDRSIKLNIYIVYSFILKFKNTDYHDYRYTYSIIKDQYRVHYHIDKIPYKEIEEIERYQRYIAKLIYVYFLARLKTF